VIAMKEFKKFMVVALVSGATLFGMPIVGHAEDDVQAACTKQAEEDGYTGEEKANAIKLCMEESAGSGDAASQK